MLVLTGVWLDVFAGAPPAAPSSLSDTAGLGLLYVSLMHDSVCEALIVSSLSAVARVGARPRDGKRRRRSKGLYSIYRFQGEVSKG